MVGVGELPYPDTEDTLKAKNRRTEFTQQMFVGQVWEEILIEIPCPTVFS